MIQSYTFIKTHISRTIRSNNRKDYDHRLLIHAEPNGECRNGSGLLSLHWDYPPFCEHTKLITPFEASEGISFNGRVDVIGTCNGLVCLVADDYHRESIVIWNPCIQRFVYVPRPSEGDMEMARTEKSYAFGYDASTNDYKVLRLISSARSCEIQIWSLFKDIWRSLGAEVIPDDFRPGFAETQTLVNGALHWIQSGEECFIRSFDISKELFGKITIPEALRKEEICQISRYKNSLALFERYEDDRQQFDMWVMKEYGVMQSWAKLFSIHTPTTQIKPFGFIKTGQVLLKYHPAVVKLVDPKTNGVRPFQINGYRKHYFVDYFVESHPEFISCFFYDFVQELEEDGVGSDGEQATAAVERGWITFMFQNQKLADDWSSIALINPLLIKEGGIFDSCGIR
nr:MYB transcription factor protein [Rosa persica]